MGGFVWVNDWYLPDSFDNLGDVKLKGWHKVGVNGGNDPRVVMGLDIVDLKHWRASTEGAGASGITSTGAGDISTTGPTPAEDTEPQVKEGSNSANSGLGGIIETNI